MGTEYMYEMPSKEIHTFQSLAEFINDNVTSIALSGADEKLLCNTIKSAPGTEAEAQKMVDESERRRNANATYKVQYFREGDRVKAIRNYSRCKVKNQYFRVDYEGVITRVDTPNKRVFILWDFTQGNPHHEKWMRELQPNEVKANLCMTTTLKSKRFILIES